MGGPPNPPDAERDPAERADETTGVYREQEETSGHDTGGLERLTGLFASTTRLARTTAIARRAVSRQRRRRSDRQRSVRLPDSSFEPGTRPVDLDQPRSHFLVWLGLGFAFALVGQALAWWFFQAAWTWSGALLFTVCGLGGWIFPVFQRNAKEIWSHRRPARVANLLLALDLSMLYLGVLAGYAALTVLLGPGPEGGYLAAFKGLDDVIDAIGVDLTDRSFDTFHLLALHNLRVLAVFFLVGLILRYLGLLFVVVYNAAVWGVLLVVAVSGELAGWEAGGGLRCLLFVIGILPHTLLETLAYVLAAMAGVFSGRCVLQYRPSSKPFTRVGRSILRLLAVAFFVLLLAVIFEVFFAHGVNRILAGTAPEMAPNLEAPTTGARSRSERPGIAGGTLFPSWPEGVE